MARKIAKQTTGGFLNTSINPDSLVLLSNLSIKNPESFKEEIGFMLGRTKMSIDVRDSAPAPNDDILHLEKMNSQIESLIENINLVSLNANAYLMEAWNRQGFDSLLDEKIKKLLIKYQCSIIYAQDQIANYSNNKGRKNKHIEHQLIYGIFNLIRKYENKKNEHDVICTFIADFIQANGIHAPTDIKSITSIITKFSKNQK